MSEIIYIKGKKTNVVDNYFSKKYRVEDIDFLKDKDTEICKYDTHSITLLELVDGDDDTLVKLEENRVIGVIILKVAVIGINLYIRIDYICSIKPGTAEELINITKEYININKQFKGISLMPAENKLIPYYEKKGFKGNSGEMKWHPGIMGGKRNTRIKRRFRKRTFRQRK
jgi:hypothetical protein